MSLRSRFAVAFALVAAVVAVAVGVLSYRAASDRITAEVDRSLQAATVALASGETQVLTPTQSSPPGGGPDGVRGDGPGIGPGGPGGDRGQERSLTGQAVAPDGSVTFLGGRPVALPLPNGVRSLAASGAAGQTATFDLVGRVSYRVLVTALGDGRGGLVVAADVSGSNQVLRGMAREVAWVSAAVLVAAAGVGWVLAWRITRRLVRLTAIAEEVSAHGEVDREVPAGGRDEVGRLSASFTTMLGRLAAAREAQDRLVQDAAHELRTPLTSLRTNASVLRRVGELSPDARDRLLDDVQGETRELSRLVDELVELALSRHSEEPDEPVALGEPAARAAERVHRRTGRAVRVRTDGTVVRGRCQAIERAIGNLLENAAKFDSAGRDPIEVDVQRGTVTVRDHGPGIADADVERVFDRFYRADAARGLPGSGLGLAIVRDVARSHGGTTFASTAPGGGAAVGFTVDSARVLPDVDPGQVEIPPGLS